MPIGYCRDGCLWLGLQLAKLALKWCYRASSSDRLRQLVPVQNGFGGELKGSKSYAEIKQAAILRACAHTLDLSISINELWRPGNIYRYRLLIFRNRWLISDIGKYGTNVPLATHTAPHSLNNHSWTDLISLISKGHSSNVVRSAV